MPFYFSGSTFVPIVILFHESPISVQAHTTIIARFQVSLRPLDLETDIPPGHSSTVHVERKSFGLRGDATFVKEAIGGDKWLLESMAKPQRRGQMLEIL